MKQSFRTVVVNDKMQKGYRYVLSAPAGRGFDPEFRPDLTPEQMLELGVFGGKYLTDCRNEFPARWFARARLSTGGRDSSLNYFGVDHSGFQLVLDPTITLYIASKFLPPELASCLRNVGEPAVVAVP